MHSSDSSRVTSKKYSATTLPMRALRQRGIERATFIASVLRWRKIRNDVISAEIIFGFRPDRGKNQANATKYKLGTKAKVQEFPVEKRSFYQTTKNTNPYATGQDPARVLPWRFPGNPMKYRQKSSRGYVHRHPCGIRPRTPMRNAHIVGSIASF